MTHNCPACPSIPSYHSSLLLTHFSLFLTPRDPTWKIRTQRTKYVWGGIRFARLRSDRVLCYSASLSLSRENHCNHKHFSSLEISLKISSKRSVMFVFVFLNQSKHEQGVTVGLDDRGWLAEVHSKNVTYEWPTSLHSDYKNYHFRIVIKHFKQPSHHQIDFNRILKIFDEIDHYLYCCPNRLKWSEDSTAIYLNFRSWIVWCEC